MSDGTEPPGRELRSHLRAGGVEVHMARRSPIVSARATAQTARHGEDGRPARRLCEPHAKGRAWAADGMAGTSTLARYNPLLAGLRPGGRSRRDICVEQPMQEARKTGLTISRLRHRYPRRQTPGLEKKAYVTIGTANPGYTISIFTRRFLAVHPRSLSRKAGEGSITLGWQFNCHPNDLLPPQRFTYACAVRRPAGRSGR